MAFLDSLIQALNDGSLNDVKSAKIVAGKEPELTNLHREEKEKDEKKEEKKEKKSSKEKEGHHKSSKKRTDDEKKKKKEKKEKEERHIEEVEKEHMEHIDRDINSNVVEAQTDQGFDEPTSSHVESPKYDNAPDGAEHGEFSAPSNAFSPAKTDDSGVSDMTESPRPPVLDRPMTSALARPQTSMGRPGTAAARPAPPKLKRKQIATVEETNIAPVQPAAEVISEAAPAAPEETFLVEEEETEDVLPDTFKVTENEVEDLDLMMRELEKWRNETKKYEASLKDKEAQGIGDTQKLTNVLSQLDDEVADVRSAVRAAKARIISNNERIHEMLNNI
ncbi:unnamed protein product [Cylicostephanus goldi]|uniref:TRAF3-interacting protein 1 C-terminal domain-containing protein n=1 Tax=Cylicostephanus goldi TaxID=71465 RepID=A0A3P7PT44_CYLGO|nr:unnamed protein product [Cylicostephanus goldi]